MSKNITSKDQDRTAACDKLTSEVGALLIEMKRYDVRIIEALGYLLEAIDANKHYLSEWDRHVAGIKAFWHCPGAESLHDDHERIERRAKRAAKKATPAPKRSKKVAA